MTAKLFETAQGETTIDAQFTQAVPFIVRGFDVFSFSVSKTGEVQLYLTEVKDYASLVPTSKFSAFGVNRASTLRLNIQKAVEAVQKEISNGKIPRNVGEEIISQLDNAGYQIRLVGNSKTVFTKDAIQAIEAATGAKVTEVIKVEVK